MLRKSTEPRRPIGGIIAQKLLWRRRTCTESLVQIELLCWQFVTLGCPCIYSICLFVSLLVHLSVYLILSFGQQILLSLPCAVDFQCLWLHPVQTKYMYKLWHHNILFPCGYQVVLDWSYLVGRTQCWGTQSKLNSNKAYPFRPRQRPKHRRCDG